jgi:RNase P subunit RPR2
MTIEQLTELLIRCPNCAAPMTYVRTIWGTLEGKIDVWACEPCQKIVRIPSLHTKH